MKIPNFHMTLAVVFEVLAMIEGFRGHFAQAAFLIGFAAVCLLWEIVERGDRQT